MFVIKNNEYVIGEIKQQNTALVSVKITEENVNMDDNK